MNNILIIGAGGFLGYNLAIGFMESEYKVVLIDKRSIRCDPFKTYKANIRDGIEDILSKEVPDTIYYLVGDSTTKDNLLYHLYIDTQLFLKTIQAAIKYNVSRVVIASNYDISHDDCSNCNNLNKYNLTTLQPECINQFTNEMYLQYFKSMYNIEFISLRIPQVYGYRAFTHWSPNLVATIIKSSSNTKHLKLPDENSSINMLYVGDAVSALIFCLTPGISGIYNVLGFSSTYKELVSTIAKYVQTKIKFCNQIQSKIKNTYRMNNLESYGWKPIVSLSSGVCVTIKHTLKHDHFFEVERD